MNAALYIPPPDWVPPAIRIPSSATSPDGQIVAGMLEQFTQHARNNATDWRTLIIALIEAMARDYQRPNWDGYGAQPVSNAAKEQAQRLVDLLPFDFPPPDPAPDSDGEVALSWDLGPGRLFTVSVSPEGALTYAGLLGAGIKRHGVERLNGEIPKIILESIDELRQRAGTAA